MIFGKGKLRDRWMDDDHTLDGNSDISFLSFVIRLI